MSKEIIYQQCNIHTIYACVCVLRNICLYKHQLIIDQNGDPWKHGTWKHIWSVVSAWDPEKKKGHPKLFLFDYATTPLLILLKNRIWVHVRMYIIVYLYGFLLTKGFGQIVAFDVFCLCFLPLLWLKLLVCRSVVYPRTSWTSFGKRSSLETWSPDMMDGPQLWPLPFAGENDDTYDNPPDFHGVLRWRYCESTWLVLRLLPSGN